MSSLSGEQCARQGQQLFAEAVGEQAVAADAHEAFWQYMQEEAAEKVHRVEGHDALLAMVGIIAPEEADALPVEGGDAVIADGHAMGVAAEVSQNMFGPTEGRLGVDVLFLLAQLVDQLFKRCRVAERCGWTSEVECAPAMELAEDGEELVAEDGAQDGNRHEEHRMAGGDPALMISRQSAAGNDAVDMVMGQQVGSPCVQDGEEADLCAEALGIGSDFEQGLGDGLEQQVKQWPSRSQCQRVQFVWQGEDEVEVVGVEQIALLDLEPSTSSLRLAFWTASRSAGVVRDGCFVRTVLTLIPMPAKAAVRQRSTARYAFSC